MKRRWKSRKTPRSLLPQEAAGDAEFAATIQSNLAAAYAKKGSHESALQAAEEATFCVGSGVQWLGGEWGGE